MNAQNWLLYGAYGYTAKLIAERAVSKGIRPILAGRKQSKLRPLAERLGCSWRCFDLQQPDAIVRNISDAGAVLNCAGPFSHTAEPMIKACLKAGIHYADINGEIDALEYAYDQDLAAKEAGIVILPGTAFDVVPSDCLAKQLAEQHPGATHLTLAFSMVTQPSPGTMKSSLEAVPKGGRVRKDGELVRVPHAYKVREVDFGDFTKPVMTFPWGDLSSAYRSTGIANIEVYMSASRSTITMMKLNRHIAKLLGPALIQRAVKSAAGLMISGPNKKARDTRRVYVYAEITDGDSSAWTARLTTPEPYKFSALSALDIVERLVKGDVPHGAHTPSTAFGSNYINELLSSE